MEEAAVRILELEEILEDYEGKAQVLTYNIQRATEKYVTAAKKTAQRSGAWLYIRQETEFPFRIYPDIEYTAARDPIITRGAPLIDQETSIRLTNLKDAYNSKMWVISVRAEEYNSTIEEAYQDILQYTTADVRFTENRNGRYTLYAADPVGQKSMIARYDLKNGITDMQTEDAQLLSFAKVNQLNQAAANDDSDLCILQNQCRFIKCEDMLEHAALEIKKIYSTLVRNDGKSLWAPVGSAHVPNLVDDHTALLRQNTTYRS